MKYTAEQLKPKKYPDEKPRMGYSIWVRSKVKNRWMRGWYTDQNRLSWASLADWFIDIPGAPPELEPLAYPQNKPEQDGEYWCHNRERDAWYSLRWDRSHSWNSNIDYFIPVRLDKENEMGVIWRADDTILSSSKDNAILKNTRNGETYKIVIWKHAFTEICLHWLDLQGYDVVKREPELLPCPFCKSPKFGCKLFRGEVSGMGMKSWIECVDECGYQSAYCDTGEEAIRLHNLIADNAKRSGLCEPGNEYYGLWCDEDGNILPRRES